MDAVLYTRVSTEEQGHSRNGLEGQLEALRLFVEAGGHNVLDHFEEVASGGSGLAERQQLRLALARARQAKAILLVSKLDRLSRSVAFISGMMAEGVPFATAEDGLDVAPMMLQIKAVFAEQERRATSERTKAGLAAKKARGEPLGYHTHKQPGATLARAQEASRRAVAILADNRARQVAPMLRAFKAQGLTMAQVADAMNEQGIATARGGRWHASSVHNALARAGA